jgi:hypothetical protein
MKINIHRIIVTIGVALACSLGFPAAVFGFGDEGHRIVCQIALDRLSPTAQTFVNDIRALSSEIDDPFRDCQSCSPQHEDDGRQMSLLQGCIWPTSRAETPLRGRTNSISSTSPWRQVRSTYSETAATSIAF